MTWLCFEDITRKKYGLLKTKRTDIQFRLFVLILNIFATPILLVVHFIIIYLFPCIQSSITGCCCRLCFMDFGLLRFCSRFLYTDKDFPPNQTSLGNVKCGKEIEWKRASEMTYTTSKNEEKKLTKLFEDGMDPADICQGSLGNCWLLSALASLSNKPSTIENAFITREFNPRGKYVLRLWDSPNKKFIEVAVDDFIPVDKRTGHPAFTENNQNEMWVMIMEKVFAKYMGSYAATEGGYSLYAMHTLTGGVVYKFNFDSRKDEWTKLEMQVHETPKSKEPDVRFFLASKHKKLKSEAMYDLVAKYHSEGCVLAAGTRGTDNTIEEGRGKTGGIVPGHAYTILQVYSPHLTLRSGIRLVKLRNPWGSFEWDGDWGDKSDLWSKHPAIKLEMRKFDTGDKAQDDGTFFMSWDDFLRHFDGIDVCFVNRDMSSLRLDVKEEFSVCGAFVGCIVGTVRYWLCCLGVYHLWCAKSSEKQAGELSQV